MKSSFRIAFLIAISMLFFTGDRVIAQDNSGCFDCHSDEEMVMEDAQGNEKSIFVDEAVFSETMHSDMSCADCHMDLEGAEDGHDTPVEKVDCASCHDEVQEIYNASIHGQLLAMGDRNVPECSSCHGTHNIFTASDSRSMVNKFNLMYTCAECHQSTELREAGIFEMGEAIPQFYESVHAKGLLRDGLIVAPSCNDCHGTHDIQKSSDPSSPVYKNNVYGTCGVCHTKLEEIYKESVHGQLVENGDRRGPVCTDCHEAHLIIPPEQLAFKQANDERCGSCHEEMLERYHETFHGKAMALGSGDVAACYDCHGYHDIQRSDDPRSPIHADNKVATCTKCHPGANENFSNYLTHADHLDKEDNAPLYYTFLFMTSLLVGVFIFFGIHTLMWIVRSVALYNIDSKTFKADKTKIHKGDLEYVRFKPLERTLHVVMIYSFTTLALTGIPLKFFDAKWSGFLVKMFGGVENLGYFHRVAALLLIAIFVIHALDLLLKFIPKLFTLKNEKGKFSLSAIIAHLFRPDSMMPQKRDITDFVAHNKYFFGKGEKPKFEKWTYWEKFDYFAVFWGIVIIGLSGLVMWAPVFFTKFLPGWSINVALIIHSDEALLAAGFIFTFHFFNVHFRIEKFPMDTVIFSGKMSHAEMEEERAGWLERLRATNTLDDIKHKDDWSGWRPIMRTFGFIAFGTGALLAVGIFTAMLVRLMSN